MEAASSWYETQRKHLGSDFLAEVDRALARISKHPRAGAPVPGVDDEEIRRMSFHRFPYHIVYLELPDRYQILAIAHDRRRPFYWRSRISS